MKDFKLEMRKSIQSVYALGKKLPVFIRGNGNISLLVLGQASLFKKPGFIPNEFDNYFKIYFVDLFEKQLDQDPYDFHRLKLDDFLDAIETVRLQLNLREIALFSHSAAGVLAVEYNRKYEKNVSLNIIVAMAPIWGLYKNELSERYFQYNSTSDRQLLFKHDQKLLASKDDKTFSLSYMARRALFFSNPMDFSWQFLWDGVNQDEELINHYFKLINDYDIRKIPSNNTPTFLALGLKDYSVPFYAWTDDIARTDHCFKPLETNKNKEEIPQKVYYIFNAAHFPMQEDTEFSDKIIQYINEKFSNRNHINQINWVEKN
jgi:proline iminopeptidase